MKADLTFKIEGDTAVGTVHSGRQFLLDAADVRRVSELSWRVNKDGYLAHYDHVKSIEVLLHRWLLNIHDPHAIVDHINRDRLDCRRCNLRVVSAMQNSANHSPFQTNKTGYTGVYYSKCSGRYEVKVGYDHRRILLGSTKDDRQLTVLAQMYNIGASFFFGDYAGALNDVPAPPDDLVKRIITKCQKYMKAPAPASAFAA